ncbi:MULTISPECIES: HAD family hydrolase [Halorussus]|uniref:HAD family hydrolase n=1 Tax=Halorussus TaxID=1070314 RepID=UPI00209E4D72|nr:HAD family hydrolase [Halorussus vallis]USZ75256.1 HAD family hydrolase [Halorussus vallis]
MDAVFFDLDGTLVDLDGTYDAVFETALTDCGVTPRPEHGERYNEAFFEYFGECRSDPYREAMADLREAFDLDPTAEALADALVAAELERTELRPGAREVLDALDAPDRPLGVLTNGAGPVQRRKLDRLGVADRFDVVVASCEVGAGKPDPEIFAAAKRALPADGYVFVADDLERDVLPAQQSGFAGVYLRNEADDEAYVEANADHAVESLREVPAVLNE